MEIPATLAINAHRHVLSHTKKNKTICVNVKVCHQNDRERKRKERERLHDGSA